MFEIPVSIKKTKKEKNKIIHDYPNFNIRLLKIMYGRLFLNN